MSSLPPSPAREAPPPQTAAKDARGEPVPVVPLTPREAALLVAVSVGVGVVALVSFTPPGRDLLAHLKGQHEGWGALQAAVTSLALVLAAWWFMTKRERYPRADLTHVITHRHVAPGVVWVHVELKTANKGAVLMSLVRALTRVQQVAPLTDDLREKVLADPAKVVPPEKTQAPWRGLRSSTIELEHREIEPEETDSLYWDFFVPDEVRTVRVYSYLTNEAKRHRKEIGWSVETIYELVPEEAAVPTGAARLTLPDGRTVPMWIAQPPAPEPAPADGIEVGSPDA